MTTYTVEDQSVPAPSSAPSGQKTIGIPKEIAAHERRVAATPETAKLLQKLGFEVLIESGAGAAAFYSDAAYEAAGCRIIPEPDQLWAEADVVLKVRPPEAHPTLGRHEADLLPEGKTLISFIYPARNQALMDHLATRHATVLAMDTMPRITRAQTMDALSAMANLAGYRAVLEAANHLSVCFTGQITAAGKMPPAKVLVIGAGVAGLAAIRTAKSLGAIVRAFDTRLVVKEQVESLGAEFLELTFAEDGSGEGGYAKVMSDEFIQAEMALFAAQAREVDVIITTALIPGRRAPVLITQAMVESMKAGSVIVDLAAEQDGNCAVTKPGEVYRYHGVTIVGLTDFPSRMACQASQLYGMNLVHLLEEMGGANDYTIDVNNEVVRTILVVHDGVITYPPPKPAGPPVTVPPPSGQQPMAQAASAGATSGQHGAVTHPPGGTMGSSVWLLLAGMALIGVGWAAPSSFLSHFTVFVLACFVGWQVIWNVKPALHTPLMSVTNAISGIIILGGLLQFTAGAGTAPTVLGAIAVFVGTINISGGFLVTQRMLKMFQK